MPWCKSSSHGTGGRWRESAVAWPVNAGISVVMKKKWTIAGGILLGLLASGVVVYATNTAPVVAVVSAAEVRSPTKPFVVKVHAQWCPVCMSTKGVWAKVQKAYAERVNLVVFDLTNETTT